jgi:hypothetical protein
VRLAVLLALLSVTVVLWLRPPCEPAVTKIFKDRAPIDAAR